MADTMIDTVLADMNAMGSFSLRGATIYNPFSAHPNPNVDPSKPTTPQNPQITRDPCPGNVIPQNMINPAAQRFLQQYVPQPNAGMGMAMGAVGCGMTMMGSPTVLGAGTDCNNYLDDRNELHTNNQGTVCIDHTFANGDSLTGRYSLSSEDGVMPQNLPGVRPFHDSFSHHASLA